MLALWKGGVTERVVAVTLLLELVIYPLLENRRTSGLQYRLLASDILFFAFLAGVALRSRRRWTLWTAAYHLLSVLSHVGKLVDPSLHGWAYQTTLVIWGYGGPASLLFGVVQVMLARRSGCAPRAGPA